MIKPIVWLKEQSFRPFRRNSNKWSYDIRYFGAEDFGESHLSFNSLIPKRVINFLM